MQKSKPRYLSISETMTALGYKTRKSVYDLIAAGSLTPHHPTIVRGKHSPRVLFLEAEVQAQAQARAPQPNRLSRNEAAARLGIHFNTLRKHAAEWGLTEYRTRRRVEFDAAEVEKLKDAIE